MTLAYDAFPNIDCEQDTILTTGFEFNFSE